MNVILEKNPSRNCTRFRPTVQLGVIHQLTNHCLLNNDNAFQMKNFISEHRGLTEQPISIWSSLILLPQYLPSREIFELRVKFDKTCSLRGHVYLTSQLPCVPRFGTDLLCTDSNASRFLSATLNTHYTLV